MKRIVLPVLLIFIISCFVTTVHAQQQGLPVDGRDFYLGFVNPTFNTNPPQLADGDFRPFFGMYALISSYTDNTAMVSYFDPVSGVETAPTPYKIFAQQGLAVLLSKQQMMMSDTIGDRPEYRACHITAKRPINVQYFSTGACAGGSYLSIPTNALGKSYVVPSWNDNPGVGSGQPYQAELSGGFFLIIGAFNGTHVTITPNGRTDGGHIGVNSGTGASGKPIPYVVTLNRGQCYWVKGDGTNSDNDLSGSTVVSDNPIGVLAGHEDAFIGEAPSNGALDGRDYMIEQVIPS
ncbi:MAG TPA: IgGFc-binding protein, partial [Bacteroidia bacterium]|nr:IgGFc-binding protein [Bacteroidia bacterium]